MDLQNRRLVITGGASGIGRATAALALTRGAKVTILDMDANAAKVAAEQGCGSVQADITDEAQVTGALAQAAQAMGGIDGLVHAAGIAHPGSLEQTDMASWLKVVAVNLTGTYVVCRAALPWLKQHKGSTIVNLSSGQGLRPGPGTIAYAASKGGVLAFGKALAQEVAPDIRVNTVCPGFVKTPMTENILRDHPASVVTSSYALQRAAEPVELAEGILFLTSHASSYVTGTTLAVDGGRCFH